MFPISKYLEKSKVRDMKVFMQNVHFQSKINDCEKKIDSLMKEIDKKYKENESQRIKVEEIKEKYEISLQENLMRLNETLKGNEILKLRISSLEIADTEKSQKMILISEENRTLKVELGKRNTEENKIDTQILLEKSEVALDSALKELIFSEDEIKNLSKDFLMKTLENDYSQYNEIIEKLWLLKWELGKQEKQDDGNENLRSTKRKLILVIEDVNTTKQNIKAEIEHRQYSKFNLKVDFTKLVDLPIFDDTNLHLYLYKDIFKEYLKKANICYLESSPYLLKALRGKPLENINSEYTQGVVPDIDQLFLSLEKFHGNMDIILEKLINQLKDIKNIPSNVSGDWNQILNKSNQTIKIIDSLKSLEKVDQNIIHYHSSLERIFKNLISNEHFQLLIQRQTQNPRKLLDNVLSIISINKDQAIEKIKYLEKNEVSTVNSFISTNQEYLTHPYGKYFLSNLPQFGISCSLCEKFSPPNGHNHNQHILCKSKLAYYLMQVSCFHLKEKTTYQRYKFLENLEACLSCLKFSQHTTEHCRLIKNKRYMICNDQKCKLNFQVCFKHKDQNQEKFMILNQITEKFGISVVQ